MVLSPNLEVIFVLQIMVRVARSAYFCYSAHHPNQCTANKMIRCHLSTLMGRDKLRISDVAKSTGLNRSTVTALYNETATRIDLPAVESLCALFRCQVGELFEIVPSQPEGQP